MCVYCERKPYKVEQYNCIYYFDRYANANIIGEGKYNAIYYGVEASGQPSIWIETDDEEVLKYFPKFCPECGKNINCNENTKWSN